MLEIFYSIDKSWLDVLHLTEEISDNILKLYKSDDIIEPKLNYLFDSFSMPISDINAVIIGQDPYPNGEGIGYAFAYDPNLYSKPKSFKMIEKEVGHELDPYLQSWRQKGIFSINASLTVGRMSHFNLWKKFTINWISYLDSVKKDIDFIFLGRISQSYKHLIKNNNILVAPHPATRYHNFIGCGIFKETKIKF